MSCAYLFYEAGEAGTGTRYSAHQAKDAAFKSYMQYIALQNFIMDNTSKIEQVGDLLRYQLYIRMCRVQYPPFNKIISSQYPSVF